MINPIKVLSWLLNNIRMFYFKLPCVFLAFFMATRGFCENDFSNREVPEAEKNAYMHVKNPQWNVKQGGQYPLCNDLAALLNDLPYPKIPKSEFPFNAKFKKFQPVPFVPVKDIEKVTPILDAWWEDELSRFRLVPGQNKLSKDEAKKQFIQSIESSNKGEAPVLFEAMADIGHTGKARKTYRYAPTVSEANINHKYWWVHNMRGGFLSFLDGDNNYHKASGDAKLEYPIYYDGVLRDLFWWGSFVKGYTPDFSFSVEDISLAYSPFRDRESLFKTPVCELKYFYIKE